MKNADKNRDPEKARARAMSDARCAWRKMDDKQRRTFLEWIGEESSPARMSDRTFIEVERVEVEA